MREWLSPERVAELRAMPFTYAEGGATGRDEVPAGYQYFAGTVLLRRQHVWVGPLCIEAPCRIMYEVSGPRSDGFAYGTLRGHPDRRITRRHLAAMDS